ncbi:MAG: hypothetical protein HQK73_10185 [Desulfamplus sp.]|nr:hypothetical protein [Desulfamplus sp.]
MRLSKLVAIAAITLLLTTQFSSSLNAEETTLDPNAKPPAEGVPTSEADAKYTGPAKISYYLSDEDFIIMKVDGLQLGEVTGFSFDGTNITEAMKQFEKDGLVEITSREDGFNLTIKITSDQLPGQHKLGLLYGDNELSATIDSAKLTTEASAIDGRAFGYLSVSGYVSELGDDCYYGYGCSYYSSYATVWLWVFHNGYWAYMGATTTDMYGNFQMYVNGVCGHVYVKAQNRDGQSVAVQSSVWSCGRSRTYVKINPYIKPIIYYD